ncbi:UDP-glucuronosyltransferase 1-1 [Homalodisca vitripennis]|nr:UDP-glucuronosyltransferase 1-1 [Homalodisca vitripennis]
MRLLIPILMLASAVESARILSVFPISGKSHHGLFQAVLKALAARGHHIVNYSPYKLDKPMANYTDVVMENIQPPDKSMTREMLKMFMNLPSIGMPIFLWLGMDLSAQTFSDKKIKELIESNEQFDLVIIEALFTQEAFLGFGHKFKAPVICLQPFNSFSVVNKAAGNPLSISYIPDMAFSSSDHMSFFERFCNTISIFSSLIFYYTIYTPKVDVMLKETFKDPTMPPVSDLIYNISLFMTNGHPYVHYAQPYTPNMIPIGGIHLSKEKKPLPAVFPEVAMSSDQGNHLLNPIPAQPHQPSGESGARIGKQSFAGCLSLVTLPPQAVCLPGPFVYTLDTIDFGLKYGAVPTQTPAKGSSRGLTKHSISSSTLNKRAIRVPDKALSYCWDVILRFPLISGVEVNREWLIEYELRSHYVGDHFENSAWVYSFSDGAMARVRRAIPPQASIHQPIS